MAAPGDSKLSVSYYSLLFLHFLLASTSAWEQNQGTPQMATGAAFRTSYKSDYRRIPDVQKQCPFTSSLSSGTDEAQDPAWPIEHELSFQAGDWFQEDSNAKSPLGQHPLNASALQLVSLWITDVNLRSKTGAVKVSAMLKMALTSERSMSYYNDVSESFESWDGYTGLSALMEGVYFETRTERGLCMVGCTQLGSRGRSCDLYMELRFPLKLTLLSRHVRGFLKSTVKRTDPSYFDAVQIASQLGSYSIYEFNDGSLLKPVCGPSLPLPAAGVPVYQGNRFCSVLMEAVTGYSIELPPTGPFPRNATIMQAMDIRCIDVKDTANVSLVFRAVLASQYPQLSFTRTGMVDGLAFAAEGTYRSSTGELCMVGCWNSSVVSSCNVHVSMSLPLAFSLTQREILVGSFTGRVADQFPPATFSLSLSQGRVPRELPSSLKYGYTRTDEAVSMAERDILDSSLKDRLKNSVLKFPAGNDTLSVRQLGWDLTVQSQLVPTNESEGVLRNLELRVFAIESYLIDVFYEEEAAGNSEEKFTRVAVEIIVSGDSNLGSISAEGVYASRTGRMYLVGCMQRKVKSQGGKGKADCSVTLTVQYPPRNTEWLMSPTLVIRIAGGGSQGEELRLETYPILFGDQRQEILSRKIVEALLSDFTLTLMVLCIALQLMHVKKAADSVPYVSLVMLAVHAFGYSVPLITGAEALFARLTSHYDAAAEAERSNVIKDGLFSRVLLYLVKILSLAAFLLMLRLCQKVIRSRIRLSSRFPLEPRRVPSEKKPLKLFTFVHTVGFLVVLGFHYTLRHATESNASFVDWDGQLHSQQQDWIKELKEYVGLMEDLFLLPQVIANSVWKIKGKPLRPAYYVGLTVLRLLPHAYSAVSKPLFNPFFSDESSVFANPRMDFYSGVGDLMIPVLAVGLAVAVYVQQSGLRWEKIVKQGSSKLMRYGSKLYERLPSSGAERPPSVKFEAEMMPSTVEEDNH